MKLYAALQAPWRSSRPQSPEMITLLVVMSVLVNVAVAMYMQKANAWIVAALIVSIGEGLAWAFLMADTVLLAIDARQLRLPGVQSNVAMSLLLYGLFCLALPTAILSAFGGRPEIIATMVAMCCLGGFILALLPLYLAVLVCLASTLLQALPSQSRLPGFTSTDFMRWAAPAAVGLLLIAMVCWRRLVHSADPYKRGIGQPMVMKVRFAARRASWGSWGALGGGTDNTGLIRGRPNWMQSTVNLRGCGPGRPARGLRVALGSMFMPHTALSWLRRLAFVLVPGLLIVLLMSLHDLQQHGVHGLILIWHDFDLFVLVWLGGFGSMVLGLVCVMQLGQSWQKPNAELPLLALLPGLGGAEQRKRDLLRASLLPPLRMQFSLLVITVAISIGMHLGPSTVLFVLLGQLGAIGFVVAFTLAVLGGRSLSRRITFGSAMLACELIAGTSFVPTLSDVSEVRLHAISLAGFLLIAWGVLALFLLWVGRRGWRGLQQRPHPFLAN